MTSKDAGDEIDVTLTRERALFLLATVMYVEQRMADACVTLHASRFEHFACDRSRVILAGIAEDIERALADNPTIGDAAP